MNLVLKNITILIKNKNKRVIGDILLYSIATGLNRGILLILFPILLIFLDVGDYGVFVLSFSISQMLIPFLTISGTAGILREGIARLSYSIYLLEKFIVISLTNFIILLFIAIILNNFTPTWMFFSLSFGFLSSLIDLFLSVYRVSDLKRKYFYAVFAKSLILLIVVIISSFFKLTLHETFVFIVFSQLTIVLFLIFKEKNELKYKYKIEETSLRNVLKYTVYIIPHGLALWLINSSDKVLIKYFLNKELLGIYSIGYTIGSFQILLNSGIGIALPQIIYRDVESWISSKKRLSVIIIFGISSILMNLLIILFLYLDSIYFNLISNRQEVKEIIKFVSPGLFYNGVYQYFAIFIFNLRKTKVLFKISLIVGISSFLLNFLLIPIFGILGAAFVTLISFFIYSMLVLFLLKKLEPRLTGHLYKDVFLIISISFAIFLLFQYM